jgi:DUF2889 family protein
VIEPPLLRGRDRYERLTEGWVDSVEDDALTHTVTIDDGERGLTLEVVGLPSPTYEIRQARCQPRPGVDPTAAAAVAQLAGARMVGGLTRRVRELTGARPGAGLIVDAVIEAARLARQVARLPADVAARARGGDPAACWELDTSGWIDLPGSCFTYSDAGRARLARPGVVAAMTPELYAPAPGQRRVFVRRKVARLERGGDRVLLAHSMHDNVHGFELRYEVDRATGRIVAATGATPRLPYLGICSEVQARQQSLVGETVDAGLARRIQGLLGGAGGCAQLYDLTADLLKLLAADGALA